MERQLDFLTHRGRLYGGINGTENSPQILTNQFHSSTVGIAGVELDVRITKDGRLIVLHNRQLDKIADVASRKKISDYTYSELLQIKIHNDEKYYKALEYRSYLFYDGRRIARSFSDKQNDDVTIDMPFNMFYNETIIPTLEEYLEFLSKAEYRGEVLIELKGDSPLARTLLANCINQYKSKLNISLQGYSGEAVLQIKEKTDVKSGLLMSYSPTMIPKKVNLDNIKKMPYDFINSTWFYDIFLFNFFPEFINALTESGKELYAWTIDNANAFNMFLIFLERTYQKYSQLPDRIVVLSNIADLLIEYLQITNANPGLIKNLQERYERLFPGDIQRIMEMNGNNMGNISCDTSLPLLGRRIDNAIGDSPKHKLTYEMYSDIVAKGREYQLR